jgi:hypothetical protein
MLYHIHNYMIFLHQTVSHLAELHGADKKYRPIARLNVCEMRLELARAEIHSYMAARLSSNRSGLRHPVGPEPLLSWIVLPIINVLEGAERPPV